MKKYMEIREETNQKIGVYLAKLVDAKYRKRSDFYREYLRHEGIRPDAEEVRKMGNRFSQIFIGKKKGLQIHDLLIITDILGISCEELLTCGKAYRPISGHMTNYEIAFSKNPKLWKKYIASEDRLFLNSDEYGKTVVDYALEFKNYPLVQWLMDEGYVTFVEENLYGVAMFLAKTKMKRRDFRFMDADFPPQVYDAEKLRASLVSLAIENGDLKTMKKMKAREIPLLYEMTYVNVKPEDRYINNERMIESIAMSDIEAVFDYFSEEYQIQTKSKCVGRYVYPDLGRVIDVMLREKHYSEDVIRMLVKRAMEHNKSLFDSIKKSAETFHQARVKDWFGEMPEEVSESFKEQTMYGYHFDAETGIVAFYDTSEGGIRSNAILISETSESVSLNSLIQESNEWYLKLESFKDNFIQTSMLK